MLKPILLEKIREAPSPPKENQTKSRWVIHGMVWGRLGVCPECYSSTRPKKVFGKMKCISVECQWEGR